MSYEKKLRDLMARLASMSPEPPPFPEESPMARHQESRKARPALVFAGAAALVIALAVPLLLFTGGGEPEVIATTTTTTIPETSTTASVITTTTEPAPTTSTAPETTTTEEVFEAWEGVVFVFQSPVDSFTSNPALVPISAELSPFDPDAGFTEALAALDVNLPDGLVNAIPGSVSVLSTQVDGGVLVADMNEAFLAGAGGLLADMTMLNQLIYTLTHAQPETEVLFTVDGQPVETFGSEGLSLTDPVGRDDFLDQVHVIGLTEPIAQTEDGWLVKGFANAFEATLVLNVADGSGAVTHEEFVTATCGTGCWGEFEVVIDADLITPGESSVRLFQYSAQDGSPVDVITVPIPVGGVWSVRLAD